MRRLRALDAAITSTASHGADTTPRGADAAPAAGAMAEFPPAFDALSEPRELGRDELASFHDSGYLLLPEFLNPASTCALGNTLDAQTKGSTLGAHDKRTVEMEPDQAVESGFVRRVYEPCTRYALFRALAESPLVIGVVSQLLGSKDLMYHYSKVNMKPPTSGVVDWQ